jgi:hypothetical protein
MKQKYATKNWFCLVVILLASNLSNTYAQQWTTNGPFGGNVNALAVSGTNIFAGTESNGVFLSTNNGASWTAANTGLTNLNVAALAVSGANLFAGTGGGVFRSPDNGASWTAVNTGLTNLNVRALAVSGANLFAGTWGGVFLSTNNGASWAAVNTGLTIQIVQALAVSGTNLFAGTAGGVFLSTNNGDSWTAVNTGLTNRDIQALAVSGTNLFAGTLGGVFLSTNNGASWTAVNTGLTNRGVHALAVSGANLFAGTRGGVFLSTNNGASWTAVNTGLTNRDVRALAVSGTNLFAGTWSGVFLSTNNGASWTEVNSGLRRLLVAALAVSGANLFAGTGHGVFLSTNNGASWTAVNTDLTNRDVRALAVSGTNLFAGTWGDVFLSTNNGASWTAVNTGLTNRIVLALAVSGTNVFAGTWGGGVFLSTNNGASWTAVNTGLTNLTVRALAVSGTNLFAGTEGGVFLSTDNGASWTAVNTGLTNLTVRALAVSGENLLAGTEGGGVFLSTNNGASWSAVNSALTGRFVRALAVSGSNLFAGTGGGGVFLSTDNGASWTAVNSGLTDRDVLALAVSSPNLFAGTLGGGVFTFTMPVIYDFTPSSGVAGATVTITGANFSPTPANNAVTFNGVPATVTASTATTLTVTVPLTATGPIRVTVGGITATSSSNFTVTDASPPAITDNTPPLANLAAAGAAINISALISDGESAVTSAELAWRSISAGGPLTNVTLQRSGNTFSASLPFAAADLPLGIEYRIQATSAGGTASTGATLRTVRVQSAGNGLEIPYTSFGNSVQNYRIVAVPLNLTNPAVSRVFDELGSPNRENWRVFHYARGATTELSPDNTLAPGLGYWLIARNDPGALQTGPGAAVNASSDAPFEIDLQADWNQIGNPYNFNLSWADVQAANPGLPGLRIYNGDFADAGRLDRMSGGFVRVNAPQKLRFPVTRNHAVNSGRSSENVGQAAQTIGKNDWQVKFSIANGQHTNTISGFGMAKQATDGFDALDGLNMPRFFNSFLELHHHKKEGHDAFSNDMVPNRDNHVWSFDVVASDEEKAVTLTWPEIFCNDAGSQLFLWDEGLKRATNMLENNRYVFQPARSKSFRIIFGSEDFVHAKTDVNELVLHTVWPNPAHQTAHVALSLPRATDRSQPVRVELIDGLGRIQRTFTSRPGGGYQEIELKDLESLAKGIYVVRVQVGSWQQTSRVMVK